MSNPAQDKVPAWQAEMDAFIQRLLELLTLL